MLVIPAIDIRHGRCARPRPGRYEAEAYYDDPVRLAKLWRVMNAKALHLFDRDALDATAPHPLNLEVVTDVVRALDIPVEVSGGVNAMEDVEAMLAAGVYRVVVSGPLSSDPDQAEEALRTFGSSRVVIGLDARSGDVDGRNAVELAVELEARGARRFVYIDLDREGTAAGPDVEELRALTTALQRARVTAGGGISGYRDLLALQSLEPRVDSVIVGRAMYENRFPCQHFWCWHQKDRVDLDQFSTAPPLAGQA